MPQSASAQDARKKVILMTSVDTLGFAASIPWYLGFLAPMYRSLHLELEETFRAHFARLNYPYDVEVYHYVDQNLLWQALHSTEYVGVYWLSHGTRLESSDSLVANTDHGIFDHAGFDATPVFQEAHPQLKALALVGCSSRDSANLLARDHGLLAKNPELQLFSEPTTVGAKAALISALTRTIPALNPEAWSPPPNQPVDPCPTLDGYFVTLERRCVAKSASPKDSYFPSLRVLHRGQIIATFSACSHGETLSRVAYLRASDEDPLRSRKDLKLTVDSGIRVNSDLAGLELGEIDIRHPSRVRPTSWKPFVKPDGTPFGSTSNVYKFEGDLPEKWQLSRFKPFYCAP